MLEKNRTFFMREPVAAGEATSVTMMVLSSKWLFEGHGSEGPARRLPEPWASAVAGLERQEYEDKVYWWAHEAAQVTALFRAVGLHRWLHVADPSPEEPLSKVFGVETEAGFEPVAEARSGSFSNHPFHGMADDHHRFEVERWVGPKAEALRLESSQWRGQDEPKKSESWFVRATGARDWTKASAPDCAGWRRVERVSG